MGARRAGHLRASRRARSLVRGSRPGRRDRDGLRRRRATPPREPIPETPLPLDSVAVGPVAAAEVTGPKRWLGRVAAIAGAAVLIGGGAMLAIDAGSASGGAESPEAAFEGMLAAISAGDLLEAAELVEPADGKRGIALCRAGTWLHLVGLDGEMIGDLDPHYVDQMEAWQWVTPGGDAPRHLQGHDLPEADGDILVLEAYRKRSDACLLARRRLTCAKSLSPRGALGGGD